MKSSNGTGFNPEKLSKRQVKTDLKWIIKVGDRERSHYKIGITSGTRSGIPLACSQDLLVTPLKLCHRMIYSWSHHLLALSSRLPSGSGLSLRNELEYAGQRGLKDVFSLRISHFPTSMITCRCLESQVTREQLMFTSRWVMLGTLDSITREEIK